ncbi:hypothetical protein R1flu_005355 [Riccia fluitans]|uniref:HTH CENPB-type domain-containing protein n=1 Tax=Riccia fluitans TaxID=41844 RepID=A0ABD1YTG6_9MARC
MAVSFPERRKRHKACHVPEVEEELYRWFLAVREQKIPVSDDFLVANVRALHEQMAWQNDTFLNDCKYSHGWVEGFKKRHGIRLRISHGKSGSVGLSEEKQKLADMNRGTFLTWMKPGFFTSYSLIVSLQTHMCQERKRNKERITVALTSDMDGSMKLPPLVIIVL